MTTPANITINKKTFHANVSAAECDWRIEAPVGKKITFSVKKFLIFRNVPVTTFSRDCKWDDDSHTGLEVTKKMTEKGVIDVCRYEQ